MEHFVHYFEHYTRYFLAFEKSKRSIFRGLLTGRRLNVTRILEQSLTVAKPSVFDSVQDRVKYALRKKKEKNEKNVPSKINFRDFFGGKKAFS